MSFSSEKFIVDAELPVEFEVDFLATKKLRIIADGTLSFNTVYDKTVHNVLNFDENKTTLSLKYKFIKYTWLNVGFTKMFDNNYKWQNPAMSIGTVKNDYRVSVGLFVHIE
jgi:hypothetical protein